MGLYFRKRVKILPGVHLNISKTGTSWSVGPRGASVNVGKRGVYVNTGIPGTGIYSRTKISGSSSNYDRDKHYSSKREQENEANNSNPLRFILTFLFLLASVMIPLLTSASWIWFPILALIGICCAFIPDSKTEANNLNYNADKVEPIHIIPDKVINISEEKYVSENTSTLKENESHREENVLKDSVIHKLDPLFEESARLVVNQQQGSTSLLQRKLIIGYNRARRIMGLLEKAGIVGPANGANLHDVLCKDEVELAERLENLSDDMFQETTKDTNIEDNFDKSSRLVNIGIDLEKEGMIDEAINVYEKSIIYRLPLKHPYERLAILYRKRKDYENEIRVIKIAIEVFMKENERRANMVIDEDNSMYNQVMQALETNESIKYEDGKWAFVQYDVMSYITRLEKAQTLLDKSKNKKE